MNRALYLGQEDTKIIRVSNHRLYDGCYGYSSSSQEADFVAEGDEQSMEVAIPFEGEIREFDLSDLNISDGDVIGFSIGIEYQYQTGKPYKSIPNYALSSDAVTYGEIAISQSPP
jgi:hypothetical protein